jgi:F420-dependent oxidoreductase-like protein
VRVGLDLAQQRMPWEELVARARLADEAGFDGIWGFDHFQPMYGSGPGECFEGWTTLAALGGVTNRVRLGLLVSGNTYRHPSLLASEVITIDHASGGRVECSLGAAWFDKEHRELGYEFPPTGERITRLDEALQMLRLLFTTDNASFDGRHYQLRDATLRPRPVQQPHPPIWIGADGERRMIPLAARHADVWHCFGGVTDLTRKRRILDEHAQAAGRDPAAIASATNLSISEPLDEVRRNVDAWRDAGWDYLIVSWPSEGRTRLQEFVDQVMPELTP